MGVETSPNVKAIGPNSLGEMLWLAVPVVAFAVIMAIVCCPLSAELLPRLTTGAASANLGSSVVPATSATADAAFSPSYSVNRLLPPDAPLPSVDLAVPVERPSSGALATALAAQTGLNGVQPSPGDLGG